MTDRSTIDANEAAGLEPSTKAKGLSRRGFAAAATAGLGAAAAGPALAAEVVETDVNVKTPDGTCDAVLFHPAGKGSWPAVIMFPDAFGLRPAFRQMGRRLASSGYVVLVPNPFYRTAHAPAPAPGFDFNKPEDRARLAELRKPLTTEGVGRDSVAFMAFLDSQKVTNRKKKAGVNGYCMGGPMTMQAAAAVPSRIGAGMSCHGGGVATDKPGSPHLLVPQMKAAFSFAIADNDDQSDPESKNRLKAAYDAAHLPVTVDVYKGCKHGWCPPDAAVYNKEGAERAWAEMLRLYKTYLV